MAVSKRTRYEVLRRDSHTCRYCGATAPDVKLHVDHVMPVALGGSNDPSNLVAACADCNAGKASTRPDDDIADDVRRDALRWSRAIQVAAQLASQDATERASIVTAFDVVWSSWHISSQNRRARTPSDYAVTIVWFWEHGLPVSVMEEAVALAMGKRGLALDAVWSYFCGICHNKLRIITSAAESIYVSGDS